MMDLHQKKEEKEEEEEEEDDHLNSEAFSHVARVSAQPASWLQLTLCH